MWPKTLWTKYYWATLYWPGGAGTPGIVIIPGGGGGDDGGGGGGTGSVFSYTAIKPSIVQDVYAGSVVEDNLQSSRVPTVLVGSRIGS